MSPLPPRPGLTVAIPARDEVERIERCLESVLTQEDVDLEVIVVDDGSSDGTGFIVRERFPEVRVLALAREGPARARSAALREATHDRIAFLDADCRAEPGWARAAAEAGDGVRMGRVISPPERAAKLISVSCFGEFLGTKPAELSNFGFLNLSAPRALFAEHPIPDLRLGEDRVLAWRMVQAGVPVHFDPEQAAIHEPAHDMAALLNRQASYARRFLANRQIEPELPGAALARLPRFLAAPLLAAGRLWRDLGRLRRHRRALGAGWLELPLLALGLAGLRAVDMAVTYRTPRPKRERSQEESA